MKLYRSRNYPNRWYAFSTMTGWVMFPAEDNGWAKRLPARGIDPIDIREVPITLAARTGFPYIAPPVEDESDFSEAA